MMKKYFGQIICELRKESGLTQEEVAEQAGFTSRYLQKLESGSQTPHYLNLFKLAEALSTTPEIIIERVYKCWKKSGRPE